MPGLADRLRERIRGGPLTFAGWMEACLYDPDEGYYMRPGRKTGAGSDADFVTPPTLHPFFGAAVGRELRALGAHSVVELGGGEGDLARSALAEMPEATWTHVERSPEHRRRQASPDPRLRWADTPPAADAGVFCEVLDAIPCDLLGADGKPVQVVATKGGGFRALEWTVADGAAAADWLVEQARGLQHVLVIDYGEKAPPREVRAYRAHRQADPFADPGHNDITVPVDFAAVASAMKAAGFREAGFETLEAFLLRHGILDRLNAIDRSTKEGASSYLRLRQLLLPTGLGAAFKVQRFERLG